jgi:hypothetical protein
MPSGLRFPDNSAACPIPRRQLHDHPIADEQPHEVPLDTAGRMRRDPILFLDLHLEEPTRQLRDYDALYSTRLLRAHLHIRDGV